MFYKGLKLSSWLSITTHSHYAFRSHSYSHCSPWWPIWFGGIPPFQPYWAWCCIAFLFLSLDDAFFGVVLFKCFRSTLTGAFILIEYCSSLGERYDSFKSKSWFIRACLNPMSPFGLIIDCLNPMSMLAALCPSTSSGFSLMFISFSVLMVLNVGTVIGTGRNWMTVFSVVANCRIKSRNFHSSKFFFMKLRTSQSPNPMLMEITLYLSCFLLIPFPFSPGVM